MPFDPNKPVNPIGGSGDPKKPSSDTPLSADDWSRAVIEEHNSWIRNWFRSVCEKHYDKLRYEPGMVARTLVGGFGNKPFQVLDADGNILVAIKPISESEYEAGVKAQGGDFNV